MSDLVPVGLCGAAAFEHPAMNTTFAIRFPESEPPEALGPAAGACFCEVDRLEGLLSRFREGSDISRINALAAGESLLVADETAALLRRAMELHAATGGAFDITIGRQTRHWRECRETPPPPSAGRLALDPERPRVTCIEPGRELDLGGIGKGFALDRMAEILADHGIGSALLQAGASTMLAFGAQPWRVALSGDAGRVEIGLAQAALSASGTGIQGGHILAPGGAVSPVSNRRRVWVIARDGASSDGLSTACFLLAEEAIMRLLRGGMVERVWVEPEGGPIGEVLVSAFPPAEAGRGRED
jgi:thiamine biosynthesis lipoprotein